MAQQYISDAGALTIPDAYPEVTVSAAASGLSTTGVVALIGEADAGVDYTKESSLSKNVFGPDQLADVVAKYKSGPLVDAFRGGATPANDPDIQGAPSLFVLVKTNPSVAASGTVLNNASTTYGTLTALSPGALGNLVYYSVAGVSEVKPTTGSFTFLPPIGSTNISLRINGGAEISYTIAAQQLPSAFQSGLQAASASLSVTGGADRAVITAVAGTLAATATGTSVVFTISTSWATTPTVGDTLYISATSVVKGGSNQNVGSYVVTAATSTTITATKLLDGSGTPGTVTVPVTVGAVAIASTTADLRAFSPVVITTASNSVIDGIGKTLEINELTTGTDRLSNLCYALNANKVTWVSKSGAAVQLTSATESSVTMSVNRQVDNVSESITAGGLIALQIGYSGAGATCAASVTVSNGVTTLATTISGGSGANLSLNLANYPTLNDLAAYINSQPGYICKVGSAAMGQLVSTALDEGSGFGAGTTFGNYTLRLKADAAKFFAALQKSSSTVTLTYPAGNVAGLPAVTTTSKWLSGGSRGATTDAVFNSAMDALKAVSCNFVVPLFSQDATADIALGQTDSASTYTIANVTSYSRTHVLSVSNIKAKRNRQAFLSQRDTFANVQSTAQGLASARCTLCFQDVKDSGANGVVQFQPWMAAVKAASMQAAGFYRALVNKGINITSALQNAGDFDDQNDTQVETALLNGLLPIRRQPNGGYKWVSDQTTYTKDNNFVFNSVQAMYAADTIALTTAQRMKDAFVGQSVADVSAAVALAALDGIMADMLRLKLLGPSDDAPKGYKNAKVKIAGPVMSVSVEIKVAGAIYFIPIQFQVTQVVQSA